MCVNFFINAFCRIYIAKYEIYIYILYIYICAYNTKVVFLRWNLSQTLTFFFLTISLKFILRAFLANVFKAHLNFIQFDQKMAKKSFRKLSCFTIFHVFVGPRQRLLRHHGRSFYLLPMKCVTHISLATNKKTATTSRPIFLFVANEMCATHFTGNK